MEPITLQGVQIIDHQRMKQTGKLRIILELTETDSKVNAGVLAIAEMNEVLFNSELVMTEIQGNNNGDEQNIEKVTKDAINERKEPSIYERFRLKCIEYDSAEYYEKVKKMLGVEHVKDLIGKEVEKFEKAYPGNMYAVSPKPSFITIDEQGLETALEHQINYLDTKMQKANWLRYSDLWHTLFDSINNPHAT